MALNKRKVLDAARKHAQKGAKAKALKEYNKLLQADPRDAKLLLEVGDAYRRWGQPDEAIAQYNKVAAQYRQDGFDARAVAVYKQILNLDPKHYASYVSLSELYQRMGLDSEAVGALQMAADGYHKEGRKPEALELLRQMAALDPSNTTSRMKVAELLRQEGMEKDALAEYEAVAEELQNQQDRDQLIAVQQRILELAPDHPEALTSLVRNLMSAGDFAKAEPIAVRALDASAEPPQYELLIELYAQMGNDAKLAEATRALAKIYRDRGDDDKARELMQRLPAEDLATSTSGRIAVDLSEVEEPSLDDEELLEEEPFLTLGEEEAPVVGEPDPGESVAEIELDQVEEAPAAAAPAPLPEGDPDQLLAEASVYLRYGKREQAIASLRAVVAQEPGHRGALEKLGEAYAEDGQSSAAAKAWLAAAEQVRAEGDAAALEVLRDRIAALDPSLAEQVGHVDPNAGDTGDSTPSLSDAEVDITETEAPPVDLDLDVEVDLDLDHAIEEVASSETESGLPFEREDESTGTDFEIDLDEESAEFSPSPASDTLTAEQTPPDEAEADDDDSIEFEIDPEDLGGDISESIAAEDAAAELSIGGDADADEELEEAEFYVAQDMFDEAAAIVDRVLANVPNHAKALVLKGEIAAARGGAAATESPAEPALETTTPLDDEGPLPRGDSETAEVEDDDSSIEIDLDDDEEEEVQVEPVAAEPAAEPEPEPESAPRDEAADRALAAAAEAEAEVLAAATSTSQADPGETFDLREALADVLEDGAPAEPSGDTSGVLSTVEDGFESIFSDFKKGVSATLDAGDYDTRYDLGIAYREMGLFEDAIGEFRVCLDSPERRFDSLYLMGLCARDLSRWEDAVSHLEQALALPEIPEERMAGVYFDLSVAQEGAGDRERACASARRVLELEPDFPGASERLAALEAGESAMPEVGSGGDGYESFDDLFDGDDADDSPDDTVPDAEPAEALESFDDVVSDAETVLEEAEVEEDPAATTNPGDSRGKSGRKKISFV